MTIKLVKRLRNAVTDLQTRQHLINLPEHLLKDIAVTREQLSRERNKSVLLQFIRSLIRGR